MYLAHMIHTVYDVQKHVHSEKGQVMKFAALDRSQTSITNAFLRFQSQYPPTPPLSLLEDVEIQSDGRDDVLVVPLQEKKNDESRVMGEKNVRKFVT